MQLMNHRYRLEDLLVLSTDIQLPVMACSLVSTTDEKAFRDLVAHEKHRIHR